MWANRVAVKRGGYGAGDLMQGSVHRDMAGIVVCGEPYGGIEVSAESGNAGEDEQ
jgi:hypothetical protein